MGEGVTLPPEEPSKPSNVNGMLEEGTVTRQCRGQKCHQKLRDRGRPPPPCLWRDQVLTKPSDALRPDLCEDKVLLKTHGWQHLAVSVSHGAQHRCVSHGAQRSILGGWSLVLLK